MHTRSMIFVVIAVLLVAAIYGSSSIPDACAAIKTRAIVCSKVPSPEGNKYSCCYDEYDTKYPKGTTATYCADCWKKADGSYACNDYDKIFMEVVTNTVPLKDNIDVKGADTTNDTQVLRHPDVLNDGASINDGGTTDSNNDTNGLKDGGALQDGGITINPGLP